MGNYLLLRNKKLLLMALLAVQVMPCFMNLLTQLLAFFRTQLGWTPLCLLALTLFILAQPVLLGRRVGAGGGRRTAAAVPGLG